MRTRNAVARGVPLLAFAIAAALTLYPFMAVEIPPLVDYPGHLAQLHILTALDSSPPLQRIYAINPALVPNLAMDVLAAPLVRLFGIYVAGRLFIATTLVLMLGGVAALNWVLHRRLSSWPAFAALFLYNFALFWGFLNFLFGVALVLWALAGWLATTHWRPMLRLAVFSAVATAVYFCHLFSFGIYGLAVASIEGGRLLAAEPARRRSALPGFALSLGQFAIPVVLCALAMTGQGVDGYTSYGALHDKVLALLSPTILSGGVIDRVAAIFCGLVLIRGLFSGALVMAPIMKAPVIALTVAAVAMPNWLLGTWGADLRLPTVLTLLLVASTRLEMKRKPMLLCIAALAAGLLSVRTAVIASQWRGYDREFAEFRHAARLIEDGASVLVASDAPPDTLRHKPYWHMPSLAVIERSVFLPTLFTDKRRHSVLVQPAYDTIDAVDVPPLPLRMLVETSDRPRFPHWQTVDLERGANRFWRNWPRRFDYVVVLRTGVSENPLPALLYRIASGAAFDLYRVRSPHRRGH